MLPITFFTKQTKTLNQTLRILTGPRERLASTIELELSKKTAGCKVHQTLTIPHDLAGRTQIQGGIHDIKTSSYNFPVIRLYSGTCMDSPVILAPL